MAQNFTLSSIKEYKERVEKYSIVALKAGSKTQGTSSETSDDDVKGIHFNPKWMDFPELTEDKVSLEGNDVISYGLDRFRRLLTEGNWEAVEMVHTGLSGGVYKDINKKEIIKFDDIVKPDNPRDRSAVLNIMQHYDEINRELPEFVNEIETSRSSNSRFYFFLWWIFIRPEVFISKDTFNNTKGFIDYNSKSQRWVGKVVDKYMDPETGEVKDPKKVQHAFRVYNTCIQCIEESEMAGTIVPLKINREGIDADWLKELKYNNKYSANELLEMLIEKKNRLDNLVKTTTVIPEHIPGRAIKCLNRQCQNTKAMLYNDTYINNRDLY